MNPGRKIGQNWAAPESPPNCSCSRWSRCILRGAKVGLSCNSRLHCHEHIQWAATGWLGRWQLAAGKIRY